MIPKTRKNPCNHIFLDQICLRSIGTAIKFPCDHNFRDQIPFRSYFVRSNLNRYQIRIRSIGTAIKFPCYHTFCDQAFGQFEPRSNSKYLKKNISKEDSLRNEINIASYHFNFLFIDSDDSKLVGKINNNFF